ncbi:hypothetical protein BV22DRAFT_1134068 [Leucogyrophana mollusca]|uniref:Uncharacterized protein n=1 Tax=Leucogyrophana mollusca TaxID=85980 RepID=A0ACB8B1Y2_9AGAM|nr:hypothetical protein BV22DRAFT_1134068 [Leucogyrophana mollusca]
MNLQAATRFDAPLQGQTNSSAPLPQRYRPDLAPRPSTLRPHCLARDRLRLWTPVNSSTRTTTSPTNTDGVFIATDTQLDRILEVIGSSWANSTKETYGAGLLVFHVYCDTHNIPEPQCCPISRTILITFLSSCAGAYSGSALTNFAAALRAWHLLHGQPWQVNADELKAILEGANRLAPQTSKRAKRAPFTPDAIILIRARLNLNEPLDAAVFTCLTTVFYGIARLGEFTVPTLKDFDPTKHITQANVTETRDRNGLPATRFHIPRTKSSPVEGEDTQWAAQDGLSDPAEALKNHLQVNTGDQSEHLFAWRHPKGLRPLSKREFTKCITLAAASANLPDLKGHSIHIGGTLEYLLRGVPFDVVKTMGRWSSEAFTLYLRHHAQILAPYLQTSPVLEPFTRYTMPPAR